MDDEKSDKVEASGQEKPSKELIFEYLDYEANKEEDFYEGAPTQSQSREDTSLARKSNTLSEKKRHDVKEPHRREHEVSSEEEDDRRFRRPS